MQSHLLEVVVLSFEVVVGSVGNVIGFLVVVEVLLNFSLVVVDDVVVVPVSV